MILSNKRITKVLIRLHECAGCSAPNPQRQGFSCRDPFIRSLWLVDCPWWQSLIVHGDSRWLSMVTVQTRIWTFTDNFGTLVQIDKATNYNASYHPFEYVPARNAHISLGIFAKLIWVFLWPQFNSAGNVVPSQTKLSAQCECSSQYYL